MSYTTRKTKLIFTLAILALAVMLMACAAIPYGAQSNDDIINGIRQATSATMTVEASR